MLKKIIFWIAIVILIIALLVVLRLITNPRSIAYNGAEIREQLLTETPIGTPEENVRVFIEDHEHWEIRREQHGDINEIDSRFRSRGYGDMTNDMRTKNVTVRMESQRAGLTSREVSYAVWRFDEDGRLVDILTRVSVYQLYGWY